MEIPSQLFKRSYFSVNHLLAADLFTRKAAECEAFWSDENFSGEKEPPEPTEHTAYVASAVMLSTAFLEATINEVFSDCADKKSKLHSALPAADLMGRLWERGIPRTARYSIIEKYEIALEISGKPPLDRSANPFQDTKLLVELRNALIHYEPEDVLTTDSKPTGRVHRFEQRFKGKFSPNPLAGLLSAFYPDELLGHGCASWAVKTAVTFSDAFFASIGVEPRYKEIRPFFYE